MVAKKPGNKGAERPKIHHKQTSPTRHPFDKTRERALTLPEGWNDGSKETAEQGRRAYRSLGPDFVHGGKYVKGHPTKTQMELARKGASGLLDSAIALAELAIDFGDETVV